MKEILGPHGKDRAARPGSREDAITTNFAPNPRWRAPA
jgi:hypothetical protein